MIVLIDNYDSFTYNLVQMLADLVEIKVKRNDDPELMSAIEQAAGIILSPGPGKPHEAGAMEAVIRRYYTQKPILGICLGHQGIGEVFGASIRQADTIYHGKMSHVQRTENQSALFKKMKPTFSVMRYHSLVIEAASLPAQLEILAYSQEDQEIMALKHRTFPVYGLQFHPESIGTPDGMQLMKNFITIVEEKESMQ